MRLAEKVTMDNAKELRIKSMEEIDKKEVRTLQDEMLKRMYDWWGTWKPDYEGWLKCADSLYAQSAVINAIGGEQIYKDYRTSMKDQRDHFTMEMGPILQSTVNDDTVSLIYDMFLMPKGVENPPVFRMLVTEFNQFGMVDGKLMVKRLDLYTDSGNEVK